MFMKHFCMVAINNIAIKQYLNTIFDNLKKFKTENSLSLLCRVVIMNINLVW